MSYPPNGGVNPGPPGPYNYGPSIPPAQLPPVGFKAPEGYPNSRRSIELSPFASLRNNRWKKLLPLAFVLLGATPWAFLGISDLSIGVAPIAWCVAIYAAIIWSVIFFLIVKPKCLTIKHCLMTIAASGSVGVPLSIYLERSFVTSDSLFTFIFVVGLTEEICKATVVVLVAYYFSRGSFRPKDYMYLGVISGLTFGAIESALYSTELIKLFPLTSSSQSTSLTILYGSLIWRFVADCLFHACTTGIVCYLIGIGIYLKRWRYQLGIIGLSIAIVLHGLNDRYADSLLQIIVAGALLSVFIGYALNDDKDLENSQTSQSNYPTASDQNQFQSPNYGTGYQQPLVYPPPPPPAPYNYPPNARPTN